MLLALWLPLETSVKKGVVNRLCIFEQDDAQSTSAGLINSLPSPDSAIALNLLRVRISHHSFDPFHPHLLSIRPHPRVQEILRALHALIV